MRRDPDKGGCFTCRQRKVRCDEFPSTPDNSDKCGNCDRLGFDCHWRSPGPGEYIPLPPKRRRRGKSSSKTQHAESFGITSGSEDVGLRVSDDMRDTQSPFTSLAVPLVPINEEDTAIFDWIHDYDFLMPQTSFDPNLPIPTAFNPDIFDNFVSNLPAQTVDNNGQQQNDETELIQHYLQVMKGYAKVEERQRDLDNLFVSAFNKALFLPPLYNAILAYSSAHLSLNSDQYAQKSRDLARKATEALLLETEKPIFDIEGMLTAIFILLKRAHIVSESYEGMLPLFNAASRILESPEAQIALADKNSFTRRVILRIAFKDCRGAFFRMGGGNFARKLEQIPVLQDLFGVDSESIQGGVGLMRANRLRLKVAELEQKLYDQQHQDIGSSTRIRYNDIDTPRREIEAELRLYEISSIVGNQEHSVYDSATYNKALVTAALNSALLYLNWIWPFPGWDTELAVQRIIQLQMSVYRDPSRANTPSAVWPSSLFFAAISTDNVIYLDWIMQHFDRNEKWGANVRKAKELAEEIVNRKQISGMVDIGEILQSTTGPFML